MYGEKLREIRQSQGLSIEELAKKSGLSPGFISQIERGLNNPSISTLREISLVLGIPIFHLFMEEKSEALIVRKDERKRIQYPDSSVTYELLTPSLNHKIEVVSVSLEVMESSVPKAQGHEGEEVVTILKGKVEAQLGQKSYILEKGDTMSYDSRIPHKFINVGKGKAELLAIVTPPSL